MCGIVGAVAERNVVPILMEGLRRLEYRGYDSAGIAILTEPGELVRTRAVGKVAKLQAKLVSNPSEGHCGIAHTRWATHGPATEANAHPHLAADTIAVVHNGIIENFAELRSKLQADGCTFESETDTEVIVNLILRLVRSGQTLLAAVQQAVTELKGAYAIAVLNVNEPEQVVAARMGSPLVIGIGLGEHFLASDMAALIPVTQQFIIMEQGEVAQISREGVTLMNAAGDLVERQIVISDQSADAVERGEYRHYMLKEIFAQPDAVSATLADRLGEKQILEGAFGPAATALFDQVKAIQIIACGTSYHAGLVARNWFEGLAAIPCRVEVASEFRYRHPVVEPGTMIVAISQSGETLDTIEALRFAKHSGFGSSLGIVNAPESSLVREADLVLMTRAGPEIGVASTKAFTTQLVSLLMLVCVLGRRHGLSVEMEAGIVAQLHKLPDSCRRVLALDEQISILAGHFSEKHHALFLGRGVQYPVAMEGALKLKEISYIHAEAYPAGELKHGPLALVDADMPVVVVAPNDSLLEKLKANMEEVRARGGELYVFADHEAGVRSGEGVHVMEIGDVGENVAPVIYNIPLQLLAYHVAVLKGTDVDQPRNLAKSVTVE